MEQENKAPQSENSGQGPRMESGPESREDGGKNETLSGTTSTSTHAFVAAGSASGQAPGAGTPHSQAPMPRDMLEVDATGAASADSELAGSSATADAAESTQSFKKPVLTMTFGPRPGFKKVDQKVKDVLSGAGLKPKTAAASESKVKGKDSETKSNEHSVDNSEEKKDLSDTGEKEKSQKQSNLSPAEQLKQNQIALPYKEPPWGGLCQVGDYAFEVLKTGVIIDNIDLQTKSFYVFGRLPSCDVTMEHPSLSRYHAIVQYCSKKTDLHDVGWYLYDLDSTHGTWINKNKVRPREYFRVRVGHVLKFGGSTRLYILQGPETDREEESDLSIAELKEQREKQKKEAEVLRQAEQQESERKEAIMTQDTSCSWGMDMEDAKEVTGENPFASEEPVNEDLYIEDPKKALKGYFEREGFDMPQYEFLEAGFGKHHCKVELPVDSPSGEPIFAEAIVSGKKREAVVQCALEACRILDRMGELRKATHESHKKKARNWEDDDFYDSDEDTFLDRTGTIEKKRMERMKRCGKQESQVDTYDSLVEKLTSIQNEMMSVESQLEKAKREALQREAEEADDLDAYMSSIKSGVMDKSTRMKLKARLFELKQEEQKMTRLVNLAKPASLPEYKKPSHGFKKPPAPTSGQAATSKPSLPMFGKMKRPSGMGPRKIGPLGPPKPETISHDNDDDNIEEEEEDDDEEMKDVSSQPPQPVEVKTVKEKQDPPKQAKPRDLKPAAAMKRTLLPEIKKNQVKKPKPPTGYDETDPDYAVWMPPTGQSGDGKTHLNEKFGY